MPENILSADCPNEKSTISVVFRSQAKCKDCKVRRRTIFSGLNTCLLDKPDVKQLAYFEKDSVVLKSGDVQPYLYCIREGWCRMVYQDAKEKSSTLWYAGPGDILGLSSICSGEKNSFSAIAIDHLSVCRISASGFRELLPEINDLPLRVAEQLSGEIERLEKRTSALHRRFIQKETARIILHIFKKTDLKRGKKISLSLFTQKIQASKNEIRDSLTAFVLEKLIRNEQGKITITDKDRLMLVAMNDEEWN
jgi:CRP-like cAMP-binding protein